MPLLAIDTTGPACSVALRMAGRPDFVLSEEIGRGHAERLAPMAQSALETVGLAPEALTRIGVTIGPGSFAGTRVGVAFARGLALAVGCDAVGVSSLEFWARQAGTDDPLAIVHDAKRGEAIVQTRTRTETGEPHRMNIEALAGHVTANLGESGAVCGSGAHLLDLGGFRVVDTDSQDLTALLDLVEAAGPKASPPVPFYARPPDAKLPSR